MDWIREYILTLTGAGILCGIVKNFGQGKSGGKMLEYACGLFLILAAVSPFHKLELGQWQINLADAERQAESVRREAEKDLAEQMEDVIRENTEAYIMDRGESFGADLTVEVGLRTDGQLPVPDSARISGDTSPYIRARMEAVLEDELDILRERQEWR